MMSAAGFQNYGPGAVFLATMVEAVAVPIPTPPFVMGAGAFLISQELSWRQAFLPILLKVALPGAAGTTVGSLVIFGLCYWGGKKAIDRYGRYFGMKWDGVQKVNARLEDQTEIALFVTRALPLFPISLPSAAAGVLRMPVLSYLFWSFAGSVLRYLMLGYLGFLTRNSYDQAQHQSAHRQLGWAAAAAVMAVAIFVYWKRRARKTA
jgi:membrane protein DedA with SNARE-associated domain